MYYTKLSGPFLRIYFSGLIKTSATGNRHAIAQVPGISARLHKVYSWGSTHQIYGSVPSRDRRRVTLWAANQEAHPLFMGRGNRRRCLIRFAFRKFSMDTLVEIGHQLLGIEQ